MPWVALATLAAGAMSAYAQSKAAKEAAKSQETATTEPWGPLQQYLIGSGDTPDYIKNSPQVSPEWQQWNNQMASGQGSGAAPPMLAANQQGYQATNPEKKPETDKTKTETAGLTPEIAQMLMQYLGPTAGTVQTNPQYDTSGGVSGGQSGISPYVYFNQIPDSLAQSAGYPNSDFYGATKGMGPETVARMVRGTY